MKKILLFLVILSILIMTSCNEVSKNNGKSSDVLFQNKNLQKITVVLDWIPNVNHTGIYVALSKGYYKEAGLDVKIVQPPEDGALQLLASGKADFAISAQDLMIDAITAKHPLPIVAVATLIQHNTSGIISLKSKNILSPKDMANHNYATWDSPIEKAIIKSVVTNDGGDYNSIKMIPSTVTDVISALKTNIDTLWVFYGTEVIATKVKSLDTNYFYIKDYDKALDYYTPVLVSSSDFLSKNTDVAKKFLAETARGYEFAIENPDESAQILCENIPEMDTEMAKEGQKYLASQYKGEVSKWGYIDPVRWNAFYDWLYSKGILKEKLPPNTGFSDAYLGE